MNGKTVCSKCGRDISRAFKFYVEGKPLCYECSEQWKKKKKMGSPLTRMIREDYKAGMKPSELAEKYHLSKQEIYMRLTDV